MTKEVSNFTAAFRVVVDFCFSFLSVVKCWLSGGGFGCRVNLSLVVVCCWLSRVGLASSKC